MQFNTPAGMTSAYERSPDLMNEMKRLSGGILPAAIGYDRPRDILDRQGRQYVEGLQQDGINAAERAQMLEYATERGYTFDDLRNAGVDPSLLFNTVTPPPKPYVPPKTTGTGTGTGAGCYACRSGIHDAVCWWVLSAVAYSDSRSSCWAPWLPSAWCSLMRPVAAPPIDAGRMFAWRRCGWSARRIWCCLLRRGGYGTRP